MNDQPRYSVTPTVGVRSSISQPVGACVVHPIVQNQGYLDFYYRENYTVVEMEAGPYLNAIYEDLFLNRHPYNEAVNLAQLGGKLDLGIIHYASDTPYTRAQTLGARGLSYYESATGLGSTVEPDEN